MNSSVWPRLYVCMCVCVWGMLIAFHAPQSNNNASRQPIPTSNQGDTHLRASSALNDTFWHNILASATATHGFLELRPCKREAGREVEDGFPLFPFVP